MAQELGATADPKALIPGNPGTVAGTAAALKTRGDALHEAGNGLKRIDTTEGWSGEAGDAFRAAFDGDPAKWLEAGDCFHDAAKALETYNSTLTWAQGQAEEAIRQWQEGQTASDQAKAQARPRAAANGSKPAARRPRRDETPGSTRDSRQGSESAKRRRSPSRKSSRCCP